MVTIKVIAVINPTIGYILSDPTTRQDEIIDLLRYTIPRVPCYTATPFMSEPCIQDRQTMAIKKVMKSLTVVVDFQVRDDYFLPQ